MNRIIKLAKGKVGLTFGITFAIVFGLTSASIALASIPDGSGVIHVCYRNSAGLFNPQGSLRVIDSDAGQSCNSNETSLNWSQGGGSTAAPVLYDANGQVIGDLMNGPDQNSALVFNQTLNRTIQINFNGTNGIGFDEGALFSTSNCTGQAYTNGIVDSAMLKTMLLYWNNATSAVYGVIPDSADVTTVNDNSEFTSTDGVTWYCSTDPGDSIQVLPMNTVTLPFALPLATPFKF